MTMETNNCPVCNNQNSSQVYVIREHTYYLCNSCGMLYLSNKDGASGSDDEQYSADYFKDTLNENMSGYMDYAKQSRPLRMNFKILLSRILPYLSTDTPKSMLDVGYAYGYFLDEARKLGLSVHGLDISESAIQWMEKYLDIKGIVVYSISPHSS